MAVKLGQGALLANRYRLLERLGEGGMGSVWKAEHLGREGHVAVKLIDPDIPRLELNLGRFLREARTLASLRSPNVVEVLDFGSDGEVPYLVMELLQGQTLGRRLLERGRLGLEETSQILSEVCAAMSLVHQQGLIHRDLKPDNIILSEAGERRSAKVVDFGIVKSFRGDMTASLKTRTGHMLGTPSYMSPEQCRGLKDIDHRADLWALGVIAYECLIGKVPFEGEVLGDLLLRICMDPLPVPSETRASVVPVEFDAWFAKAVARDRDARFQSAAELASAFGELARGVARSRPAGLVPAVAGAPQPYAVPGHSAPNHPQPSSPEQALPSGLRAHAPSVPAQARVFAPRLPPLASASATDTPTMLGLVRSGRGGERRARHLLLGAVGVLAIGGGAWALGPGRAPEPLVPAAVVLDGLRPADEVVPKVLHPRVPTGRRLPPPGARSAESVRETAPLRAAVASPGMGGAEPGSSSAAGGANVAGAPPAVAPVGSASPGPSGSDAPAVTPNASQPALRGTAAPGAQRSGGEGEGE